MSIQGQAFALLPPCLDDEPLNSYPARIAIYVHEENDSLLSSFYILVSPLRFWRNYIFENLLVV